MRGLNPPLIVDSEAVPALAIPSQGLEPITGRHRGRASSVAACHCSSLRRATRSMFFQRTTSRL
jgi:hypothetical protein